MNKNRFLILGALAFASACFAASRQTNQTVTVQVTGGHDTDPRDHGRPVILVASALKVPPQVFRDAFSHVIPAPLGEQPDPEQVRRNKEALLDALAPYGVTNDRLDEVSNYYRYNGRRELWRHRDAKITATIHEGKILSIAIVDPGAGYSSTPALSVPGLPDQRVTVKLGFGLDLQTNGSIRTVAD
jgi:hypothetical protein